MLLTTNRVRTLAFFSLAAVFATVPLTFALASAELTGISVPLAQREGPARTVLIALIAGAAVVAALGALTIVLERRGVLTARRGRRLGRPVALLAGGLLALSLIASIASGNLRSAIDSFTSDESQARSSTPTGSFRRPRATAGSGGRRRRARGATSRLVGWGAGSFPLTHKLYRRDVLTVRQPHSVPLQFLAETGIIGALLALGGLLALLAAGLARTRETPWAVDAAGPRRPASAALLAIGVAWLVHSTYDWDWDLPAVTMTMFATLGVLVARRPRAVPLSGGPGLRSLGFAGVIAALVLVTVSA